MIKSELVQRMVAHNPHLYQRDIENIVDAILREIADALSRGERVELRGFGAFSAKQRQAHQARPAHRRQGAGDREARPLLQGGQGNARAAQPRARPSRCLTGAANSDLKA
jgi:integration host factor subunit beta